ncbi:MAG: hypothetical protein HFH93_04070 [Lachnospiraceae bacterium]|nr:hypothetical protein [Lachnospiraceae bacterium]
MFGLSKSKSKNPEEQLKSCQQKRDWAGLARAYYDMGTAAMEEKDLYRAVLWLHRADTIFSADDRVYKKVGEKLVDDCSDRIGTLEDGTLVYNDIYEEITERAQEMADIQVRLWDLLAIARLTKLGEKLGELPGCEVLGQLGYAVDLMFRSFQSPISQEEYNELMDICNALYEFGDSEPFYAGGEIDVPGKAPFQVFDLNGMFGVHLQINGYIDSHLRLLAALSNGQEPDPTESFMNGCSLLPDYYVRTTGRNPDDIPQIQAELSRIWDDCQFVCSGLDWDTFKQRLDAYKELDILGEG